MVLMVKIKKFALEIAWNLAVERFFYGFFL